MSVQPVPRDTSMKRVLLVGGFPQDVRRIGDDLRPYGVTIEWQWQSRAEARRRDFPTACDAVIVASKACSHALQDSARTAADKAGVPLVVFASKSRSLEHLRQAGVLTLPVEEPVMSPKTRVVPPKSKRQPYSPSTLNLRPTPVLTQAALNMTPPPEPAPEPATHPDPEVKKPLTTALTKDDKLDEIIIEMHDKWSKIPVDEQRVITKFLVAYDMDRRTPIPHEAVKVFKTLNGQPRAFLAFVLHATHGNNIMQNSAVKLHLQFYKRGVCATSDIPTRARGLGGPEVGFRAADRSAAKALVPPVITPPAPVPNLVVVRPAPEPVIQNPPPQEMPVSNPTPKQPPTPSTAMADRFNKLLMAAVESGEKITVQKAKNGTAYAITYEDGVTLTLSA